MCISVGNHEGRCFSQLLTAGRKSTCRRVKGFGSKCAFDAGEGQKQAARVHPPGGIRLLTLMVLLMSPLTVFMSEGRFIFDCPDIPAAGYSFT